jgi:hypothetical protein
MKRDPKPSPALRRGQQRSRRVQRPREHYEAVLGLLCRRGHAELLTDGVCDSELTRVLIGLSIDSATADDPHVEYSARDPRNLIQWTRRHPQRLKEILTANAQTKKPSTVRTLSRAEPINIEEPIDHDYSNRMCGGSQTSLRA